MTTPPAASRPDPRSRIASGPRHRVVPTRLGTYYLAADNGTEGDAIVGLWRADQAYMPTAARLGTRIEGPDPLLDEAAAQLVHVGDLVVYVASARAATGA